MDLATISVGVLAAVAVMLLLVGLFGGRKAGVNARLEQYAAGQPAAEPAKTKGERRSLGKVIATTAASATSTKWWSGGTSAPTWHASWPGPICP